MSGTNQHTVALEARRWVVRLDELCGPEQAELDCWLEASDLHRFEFAKAWVRWQNLECLRVLPDDPAAYETRVKGPANEADQKHPHRLAQSLAFAATFACVAVVVAMLVLPQEYRGEYSTEVGEQLDVELPDGSAVLLNTDTSISVHFTGDARHVVLERGEAHFDAVNKPARPFVVAAGTTIVRAVGTAFTVQVLAEELEVTVTDGEVEIGQRLESASHSGLATIAGMKPLLHVAAAHTVRVTPDDFGTASQIDAETIDRKLAWHHGMLDFVNAPLSEVIADASRYTDWTLEIVDPKMMDHPVTVIARADSIEDFLDNLDASTNALSITRVSQSRVVISSTSP